MLGLKGGSHRLVICKGWDLLPRSACSLQPSPLSPHLAFAILSYPTSFSFQHWIKSWSTHVLHLCCEWCHRNNSFNPLIPPLTSLFRSMLWRPVLLKCVHYLYLNLGFVSYPSNNINLPTTLSWHWILRMVTLSLLRHKSRNYRGSTTSFSNAPSPPPPPFRNGLYGILKSLTKPLWV